MKILLFETSPHWAGLILRLTVGFIMLPHGVQKLFGYFGGYGYENTMTFFTQTMGLPWAISFLIIVIEFFGATGLLLGLGSRVWSAGFTAIMVGAIITTNFKNGLFMNWGGNQEGEGYEYHLLVIGLCMALVITGSGRYSFDGLIQKKLTHLPPSS